MPGFPDWTGTPLISGTQQLLVRTSGDIAPNGSDSFTVPVTRPGYLLEFHLWNDTDTVTKAPIGILMSWLDGVSGDSLDHQGWNVFGGTVANPHFVHAEGPTKGGSLNVQVFNNSAAGPNIKYFVIVNETTAAYPRHDWRSDDVFSYVIPGETNPSPNINADLFMSKSAAAIGAGATINYALPLFNGLIQMRGATSLNNNTLQAIITPDSDSASVSAGIILNEFSDATGNFRATCYLPRDQCQLAIKNTGAGAATFNMVIVGVEK